MKILNFLEIFEILKVLENFQFLFLILEFEIFGKFWNFMKFYEN
jgi:hypothetical protein